MAVPDKARFRIALAALCFAWTAAQLSLAWTDAPIVDEPIHLFDGSLAVDLGDPTANPEHPPLAKALAAAAARPWRDRAAPVPPGSDPRAPAPALLVRPHETARVRLFAARLPAIAMGLAAVLVCGVWGASLGGAAGGLAAAALLASSTLFGAHAHFVATDVPVAALLFCGAFFLDVPEDRFTVGRVVAAGALLGAALSAKYSAVFFVPVLLAVSFLRKPKRDRLIAHAAVAFAALASLAAVTGWASRGATAAEVRREIADARAGESTNKLDPGGMAVFLRLGNAIAPASPGLARYCLGTALVGSPAFRRGGYPAFFHGRITTTGAAGYFPACVAFKFGTFAVLAGLAGLVLAARRLPLFAVLPPLLYFAAAIPSHYLLGARYLLPIYPFLCLWAAPLGRVAPRTLLASAALSLAGAAWAYPYWIADSSLAGRVLGPMENWFADSNLDWGQDLGRLAERAASRRTPVFIVSGSEFGNLDELYPALRFPDVSRPLPPGLYSLVRWRPFLRAAVRPSALALYPPGLRPVVLRLSDDYDRLYRTAPIDDLSTPSMRGAEMAPERSP